MFVFSLIVKYPLSIALDNPSQTTRKYKIKINLNISKYVYTFLFNHTILTITKYVIK